MSAATSLSAAHPGPALAMLELASIPCGLRALDALVKEASVVVLAAGTIQCGHYLIAFGGDVEAVVRAYDRAVAVASATGAIVDRVLLPDAESRILPAFHAAAVRWPAPGDALGVLQTTSSPSVLAALDAALKGANVELVELRVAEGLAGKAVATLWGEVYDVEAAIELAKSAIERQLSRGALRADTSPSGAAGDRVLTAVVIPNADDEVRRAVGGGTRFFKEFRG